MDPVPRVPPHELRASDADRERTASYLRDAAADGRLTLDEHRERLDHAYAARTLGELAALTADLGDSSVQQVRFETKPIISVCGSEQVSGRWVVPERMIVAALFGEVKLDLTEALLQRRTVTVRATVVCGTVKLLVPDGVEVRMSGPALVGTKSSRVRLPEPAGGPVVEVRGVVLCGAIKANTPRRRRFGRGERD